MPNFRSRRESAEDNVPDPGHCWQAGGSLPSVPQRARGAGQTYRSVLLRGVDQGW